MHEIFSRKGSPPEQFRQNAPDGPHVYTVRISTIRREHELRRPVPPSHDMLSHGPGIHIAALAP